MFHGTSGCAGFDVSIDEEVRRLVAGDSFYVQPNLAQGAVCQQAGALLGVFSPVRDDFLNKENA